MAYDLAAWSLLRKSFSVCFILHNLMLMEMESLDCDVRVGQGTPLPGDGIWLRGDNREFDIHSEDLDEAMLWGTRCEQLAEHIHYCARRDKCRRRSPIT